MHPRRYETLILLTADLQEGQIEQFKNKVTGILESGNGKIVSFEDWGRRRLAYPVRKEIYGYYLLYDFQGTPELSAELERNLKIDEHVSKFLTLVLSKKFTDEDLVAVKEKMLLDAAKKEAESQAKTSESEDDVQEDDDFSSESIDQSELDEEVED